MPSNLLAHHVNVLIEHGLVERPAPRVTGAGPTCTWSTALAESRARGQLPRPPRVLFVCTANSARSHLAVGDVATSEHDPGSTSAGTHPADRIDPGRSPLRSVVSDLIAEHASAVNSTTSSARRPHRSPSATSLTKNWVTARRCTGPFPIRSASATTTPSTRPLDRIADGFGDLAPVSSLS